MNSRKHFCKSWVLFLTLNWTGFLRAEVADQRATQAILTKALDRLKEVPAWTS